MGIIKSVAKWAVGAAAIWFIQNKVLNTRSKKYSTSIKKKPQADMNEKTSSAASSSSGDHSPNSPSSESKESGASEKSGNLSAVKKGNARSSVRSKDISSDNKTNPKTQSVN